MVSKCKSDFCSNMKSTLKTVARCNFANSALLNIIPWMQINKCNLFSLPLNFSIWTHFNDSTKLNHTFFLIYLYIEAIKWISVGLSLCEDKNITKFIQEICTYTYNYVVQMNWYKTKRFMKEDRRQRKEKERRKMG